MDWVFGQPPHFVSDDRAGEMAAELETMPDDDHKRKQMRLVKARYPRPAPWLPCTMCTWVKSLVAYERIGWLLPPPKPPRKPRRRRSREEILRAHVKRTERELARLRRELKEVTPLPHNLRQITGRPSTARKVTTMSTVPRDGDAGGAQLMEPWAPGAPRPNGQAGSCYCISCSQLPIEPPTLELSEHHTAVTACQ